MLLFVEEDKEYIQVRRRGRFPITKEEAASPLHFGRCIMQMQELMIAGLAKHGYQYTGRDFELRGPEPHIDYSTSSAPDYGPPAIPPEGLSPERQVEWEKAEKARTSRKVGSVDDDDLVDYILVGTFKKPTGAIYRSKQTGATGRWES